MDEKEPKIRVEAPEDIEPGVYTHTDPLLKRLRFQDPHGQPVTNIKRAFLDKKVLIFFIGSLHGDAAAKELHQNLIELAIRQAKTCAIIYVSSDLALSHQSSVIGQKPYWRLTMNDNSDFAGPAGDEALVKEQGEMIPLEDFIKGTDIISLDVEIPREGEEVEEDEYLRPLSRSGLAAHLKAFGTPSLYVYHLPTHKLVAENVNRSCIRPGRIEGYYDKWKEGQVTDWNLLELWQKTNKTLIMGAVAILYMLFVRFYGDDPLMSVWDGVMRSFGM